MKDTSIFQGWKELTGDNGTISFEKDGSMWKVYRLQNGARVYECRIDAKKSESNKALYARALEAIAE